MWLEILLVTIICIVVCLIIYYFVKTDKQMKLDFKHATEKWEKFKSQIKPGTLLQIEKTNYNPFDESKYEIIEILEIREGWAKYNFIDKNRKLKRDFIDQIRNLYGIGYEIVQPETMKA